MNPIAPRVLSQEEVAFENEVENSPLKVFYLQYKQCFDPQSSFPSRLQWISQHMRILWIRTFRHMEPLNEPTLNQLKALETEVIEENLERVGELWKGKCLLGRCGINVGKVRQWLITQPQRLRERFTSAQFCENLVHRCTFIPPEVIPLIPDNQWELIGSHSVTPNPNQWGSNWSVFAQVALEKRIHIPQATLEAWFSRIAEWDFLSTNSDFNIVWGSVSFSLLDWMNQNVTDTVENSLLHTIHHWSFDDFMVNRLVTIAAKVSDPCLNNLVIKASKSSNLRYIGIHLIRTYSERIRPDCLGIVFIEVSKSICNSVNQNLRAYQDYEWKTLLQRINRISEKDIGLILNTLIEKIKRDHREGTLLQKRIKDVLNGATRIFTKDLDTAVLFLARWDVQNFRGLMPFIKDLSPGALGEMLKNAPIDVIREILKRGAEIPQEALRNAFITWSHEEPLLTQFLEHVDKNHSREAFIQALIHCILVGARSSASILVLHMNAIDNSLVAESLAKVFSKIDVGSILPFVPDIVFSQLRFFFDRELNTYRDRNTRLHALDNMIKMLNQIENPTSEMIHARESYGSYSINYEETTRPVSRASTQSSVDS